MSKNATILTSKSVTKKFGGLIAVNNFDFDVPDQSIVSIIGPNGAGKTTYFNCVTGFYSIDEGEIEFNGTKIDTYAPDHIARMHISRTYQNIRLFANMSAMENILVGMEPQLHSSWIGAVLGTRRTRTEEDEANLEAQRLLEFVGLSGKGDFLAKNPPSIGPQ